MTALDGSGVQRLPLTRQVADAIIGWISSGQLQPGDELPAPPDLLKQFDVSRTVVREAVSELLGRGYVVRRGRDFVVSVPGRDQLVDLLRARVEGTSVDIRSIVELRVPIERQTARLAATRGTDEDLSRVRQAFSKLQEARQEGSFSAADQEFHSAIAVASANILLPLFLGSLMDLLQQHRHHWYQSFKRQGRLEHLVEEHRRVLDALEARDPDAAEDAMAKHLLDGLETMVSDGRA